MINLNISITTYIIVFSQILGLIYKFMISFVLKNVLITFNCVTILHALLRELRKNNKF